MAHCESKPGFVLKNCSRTNKFGKHQFYLDKHLNRLGQSGSLKNPTLQGLIMAYFRGEDGGFESDY